MSNVIEIRNLSKEYDDFSLRNISLDIPEGSVVGLVGENGSGKSTLISSMLGLIKSDYEKIDIFGKKLSENEKAIKEDIAVIFDNTYFNTAFTPEFIGKIMSRTFSFWDMETYHQYIRRFGIPLKKKIGKFSRGMKMKLEFAIALSHDAKLIILDEATSGLDPVARDEILSILREYTINEAHTVIIASHITSDLDKIADYVAYMHQGQIMFMESYDKIRDYYGVINVSREFLSSLNQEDIIGVIYEPYNCCVLIKNRLEVQNIFRDLQISRPTVEEIMLFYAKGGNRICVE